VAAAGVRDNRAAELAAGASAGALLMFNSGPEHGEAIGEFEGDPLYHASLARSEYETLIRRSGFEVIGQETNDPAAGGRTVWFCRNPEPGRP